MDMDFATSCPLVRLCLPRIRLLFVGSRFRSTLPSDGPSRFRPCASLVLHLHQVAQGTFTPRLPDMPGTHRDRGAPRDAAPPTPPGIRVRTAAVRRIKLPPSSYGNQVVAGLSHSDDAATAYTSLSQPGSAVHATRPSKRRHVSAFQCYRRCETSPLLVLSFNPLRGPFGPSAAEAAYYALC